MVARYISKEFGKKLLEDGTITKTISQRCDDNSFCEMIAVTWTNGVPFIVMKLNGEIIKVSGC